MKSFLAVAALSLILSVPVFAQDAQVPAQPDEDKVTISIKFSAQPDDALASAYVIVLEKRMSAEVDLNVVTKDNPSKPGAVEADIYLIPIDADHDAVVLEAMYHAEHLRFPIAILTATGHFTKDQLDEVTEYTDQLIAKSYFISLMEDFDSYTSTSDKDQKDIL